MSPTTQGPETQEDHRGVSLTEFMALFGEELMSRVREALPPIVVSPTVVSRGRKPLGVQALASTAMVEALKRYGAGFLVAEMSTGKTKIALDALMEYNPQGRYLVMCPPHLVEKWRREAEMEGFHAVILSSLEDIRRLPTLPTPLVAVLSREKAKLGPGWKAAFYSKPYRKKGCWSRRPVCPRCLKPLVDKKGFPLLPEDLGRKKHKCPSCGEPLWEMAEPRRVALADALKRNLPRGFFKVLVLDEAHEYKGQGSAQGVTAGVLADWVGRVLVLTGTLFGGYASSLFALFHRFLPGFRKEYGLKDVETFVRRYGVLEEIRIHKKEEDGRWSRRRSTPIVKEKPGLSPLLLPLLLPHTAFVRLPEVAEGLPPYREEVVYLSLEGEHQARVRTFYSTIRAVVAQALAQGNKKLLGGYLQAALHGPDAHFTDVPLRDPETGRVLAVLPAMEEEYISPKERWLLDLVHKETAQGRRVLVYVQNTETRDQVRRLVELLKRRGFEAAGLYANTVPPEKREAWLRRKVQEGVRVLVAHPRLVQTGLDLIDFPTLVFYQAEYSVYTLRQAARRSLRIGQTQPVRVYFLTYEETLQKAALQLIATKARTSLALEGELVEGGLTVASEEDPTLFLARSLVGKLAPEPLKWQGVAGVPMEEKPDQPPSPKKAGSFPTQTLIPLPTLKEPRVVRHRGKKMVLPAGQMVLFEEIL